MLKFIIVIFTIFANTANSFASDNIYLIEDNEIYLENNGNVLELRENAKEISFQNAFNILSRKILDPSDILQFEKLQDIEVSNLVKDYQIQSEKINDVKYFANISVNFNKKKVKDFFLNNNIIINVLISEEYLVFPLFKKFNTLYLWEKDNLWYDNLIQEYDDKSLLKLFFPEKSHLNKFRISPTDLIDQNYSKIQQFLDFYKKKKGLILYLEEDFDSKKNKFKSNFVAKLFFNSLFKEIDLLKNEITYDNSEYSRVELIAKEVVTELENWWKSKIDDFEVTTDNKFKFDILIRTNDLKKVLYIEKTLKNILNENDLNIKEINKEYVIYNSFSSFSVERLNLALESKNLKLTKSDEENIFIINYY